MDFNTLSFKDDTSEDNWSDTLSVKDGTPCLNICYTEYSALYFEA